MSPGERRGTGFARGCLMARRLVEAGVSFVEVDLGGRCPRAAVAGLGEPGDGDRQHLAQGGVQQVSGGVVAGGTQSQVGAHIRFHGVTGVQVGSKSCGTVTVAARLKGSSRSALRRWSAA